MTDSTSYSFSRSLPFKPASSIKNTNFNDFAAQTFHHLCSCLYGAAGSNQIVDQNNFLSQVSQNLYASRSLHFHTQDHNLGKSSHTAVFLFFRMGTNGLCKLCHRHTENKTSRLSTCNHIHVHILEFFLNGIDCQLQSVCVLQDTGYITKNNSRFRKSGNTSHIFFKLFITISLLYMNFISFG